MFILLSFAIFRGPTCICSPATVLGTAGQLILSGEAEQALEM